MKFHFLFVRFFFSFKLNMRDIINEKGHIPLFKFAKVKRMKGNDVKYGKVVGKVYKLHKSRD